MPKIILSMSMKDINPIIIGIKQFKMKIKNCPYFDGSNESKLYWEGYDAAMYEDAIAIKDEWNDEIIIFNGHAIEDENI